MSDENPKILIDSASPKERRSFLKKLAGVVAGVTALGGFTNLRAKRTFSGTEVSTFIAPEAYLGSISMTGITYPPRGWADCNGQIVGINDNPALFSLLGTNYGGNGTSTFGYPDLRGRVPVHLGKALGQPTNYFLGALGGNEEIALTNLQLPNHTHAASFTPPSYTASAVLEAKTGPGGATADPTGAVLRNSGSDIYSTATPNAVMSSMPVTMTETGAGGVAIGSTGSGLAFDIRQPFMCVRFVICFEGLFPPRN